MKQVSNNLFKKLIAEDMVEVIDQFLKSPETYLNLINDHVPLKISGVHYPGRIIPLPEELISQLKIEIGSCLGYQKINLRNARLRITTAEDNGTQTSLIHTDTDSIRLVVYLRSPGKAEDQGTRFYFHPRFENKKMPLEGKMESRLAQALLTQDFHFKEWICWHEVNSVPNRAIFFDGHLYHSGPVNLGGEAQNPRINLECSFDRHLKIV